MSAKAINRKADSDLERILELDRPGGMKSRLKLWIICATVVTLALAGVFILAARNGGTVLQYRFQEVQRGDLTITVTATGNLQPLNQVDVGVEVSGTIETVEADYNDQVKAGQVLARLDISKLQAQVLQARAGLALAQAKVLKASANRKQAQIQMRRLKHALKLSEGRVPSKTDMDVAEAALQSALAEEAAARAEVSEAKAALQFHETELSKAVIRSPINGIVLARHVEPGQTVAASLQTPVLFTLAEDLRQMEAHVDVDEADVGQVREGQAATFTVDAYPDRTFSARVTEVRFAPKIVEGVVTYETVLTVDNADLALRPGMTATADILAKRVKDVLLVPNAALRFTPAARAQRRSQRKGGLLSLLLPHAPRRPTTASEQKLNSRRDRRVVWILRDGKPVAIPVTVGASNGQMTEVLAGDVRAGMRLLTGVVIPGQ